MANFGRNAPPIAVVLASLVLWVSFAWGLPAEAAAAEAEADVAPQDPWAGVRLSAAYDYARCPECGTKNEIRAVSCSQCRYELPQPSAEVTDPDMVFVPGLGYYREGTLLERGGTRKDLWVPGVIFLGAGGFILTLTAVLGGDDDLGGEASFMVGTAVAGVSLTAAGGALLIFGLAAKKEPVYALGDREPYDNRKSDYYALHRDNSAGVSFKVEVTALGFL